MLIQPFVENAIIHGIMPLERKGLIKISIREKLDNSCLICEITDNGIGREESAKLKQKQGKTHKSVGMQLTRERLASLNSETEPKMSFNIADVLDEQNKVTGTKVIIQIPYVIG
jgi:sensor histidine kinase YesM